MENELKIKDFFEFYSFASNNILKEHEEVSKFITIMDSVSKSCGCVRGVLHERAKGSYERMLPFLEVDCQDFFLKYKEDNNFSKILFFSDEQLLLSV